jgi:hypothetical protein
LLLSKHSCCLRSKLSYRTFRWQLPENSSTKKFEDRLRERRTFFAGQEANRHERLRAKTRQAYEIGWESSWQQLLDSQPRLVTESPANVLECATPDTYLGIGPITTTLAAQ